MITFAVTRPIFWVVSIIIEANNPRLGLEHIKSRIRTFPAHFLCWWSWTCVFAPFCMDKCIFRKKRLFCNSATRWNKILQFVPSFPIYRWVTWWCDFFLWGQPLKIILKNSGKKRSSPLDFIFDPCALASWSHFFGWWNWTYVITFILNN